MTRRLLTLLVTLAVLPWWLPPPAARAAPAPATLTITTLSPSVVTEGSRVQVSGELANTGRGRLRNVEVRLRLSDTRLNSRAELAAVAAGRTSSRDGDVVASRALPDLPVDQVDSFSLSQPVDELVALTEFGVYVLGVEVLASRASGFGRVAIERTLLPWVPPDSTVAPTGFSWLWPLVARPTRLADGAFADDTLAAEFGPVGRLTRLVAAGVRLDQTASITWAVDPELLAAAEDMADETGYQVQGPGGETVPGGAGAEAADWLEQVRAATLGSDVIALPYGDVDLTAITRAGLRGDLTRARADGAATVTRLLPAAASLPGTVWPVDGYLNAETLATLRGDEPTEGVLEGRALPATTVILDGRAVPTEIDLSYTPSGRADIGSRAGQVRALLAEPGLADLLRRPGPNPILGAQRFLAETAMITSELPSTGTSRAIVVMPPRRWTVDGGYLDRLVSSMAAAPWAAPVSLRDLTGREPPEVDRAGLRYPPRARRRELNETYLRALRTMHSSIALFSAILRNPDESEDGEVARLNRAALLLESTWWRGRPQARSIRLDRDRGWLTAQRGEVTVQPGRFTFSSRRGPLPVTLTNGLDQAVRVRLRLDPRTTRIRLKNPTRSIPIGPGQKVQVEFPATAVAGGNETIDARLHTPQGAPYGQPVQLVVNITDYGTVGIYITVGAAVVLFLTAGGRVLRRLRAAGTSETSDPS